MLTCKAANERTLTDMMMMMMMMIVIVIVMMIVIVDHIGRYRLIVIHLITSNSLTLIFLLLNISMSSLYSTVSLLLF